MIRYMKRLRGRMNYLVMRLKGVMLKASQIYIPRLTIGVANSDFLTGRSAIQGFIQGMMDSGIQSIQLITDEIEEFEGTAIEIGRFILKSGDDEILTKASLLLYGN